MSEEEGMGTGAKVAVALVGCGCMVVIGLVLVAAVTVGGLTVLGNSVEQTFEEVSGSLDAP